MYHEHPFKIFRHAVKNIWLLIFPILRGIRSISIESFYEWLKGTWFDILIILFIIGFGCFRWLFTWYRLDRHHIRLMTGVFIKTVTAVPYDNISTVTMEQPFYLRPFGAIRINIDTAAGLFSSVDMKLLVRKGQVKALHKRLPRLNMKESRSFQFKPKIWTLILFSFIFSSSLSGVIYLITLIFQGGKIVNSIMQSGVPDVYKIANDVSQEVSEKVPIEVPTAAIIMIFVLAGTWIFSFISNVFRYVGFTMKNNKSMIRITSGAVTKRTYHIMPEKINYIDLRQNFLMKIFRIASVHINCPGYGRSKYELPVILPILNREQTNRFLDILDFGKYVSDRKIRPERLAWWSYISIPTAQAVLLPAAEYAASRLLPMVSDLFLFSVIITEIPLLWLIVVKIAAFFTTGVNVEEDFICIRYSRFFAFHTILVDKRKLVKIKLFQDVIDERIDRVRMDFYFSSESTKVNKVKGLNINDAKKIIEMFGFTYEEGSEKLYEIAS